MDNFVRRALLLSTGCLLSHCTPDFDSLTAGASASSGRGGGGGDTATGGASFAGGSAVGGDDSSAGRAGAQGVSAGGGGTQNSSGSTAGNSTAAGSGGAGGDASTSGVGGSPDDGGEPGAGGEPTGTGGEPTSSGGQAGSAGQAGSGGQPGCVTPHAGMSLYNDFDAGVEGPGFPAALAFVSVDTTKGATLSSAWDTRVGASCPGALHFAAQFMEYVAGAPDERAYGSLDFTPSDWSGAVSLHMMVKLSPPDAPLSDVRLFVMSGDSYLFRSVTDTSTFRNGEWNEMVVSLVPDETFDATKARRVGVQLTLSRAGTAGLPAQPPTIHFWLDDIWVEPS